MKRLYSAILTLFILLCYTSISQAEEKFADLKLIVGEHNKDTGTITAAITFNLKPKWHLYWRTAGDTGFPVTITADTTENVESLRIFWPLPERSIVDLGTYQSESYIYKNKVTLPLQIKPATADKESLLNLNIDYAVCSDICIAEHTQLSSFVPAGYRNEDNLKLIKKAQAQVPTITPLGNSKIISVNVSTDNTTMDVALQEDKATSRIFIEAGQDFSFLLKKAFFDHAQNATHYLFNITALTEQQTLTKPITITYGTQKSSQEVMVPASFIGNTITATPETPPAKDMSILWMIIFGFIGGIILNIMPCVLPVLSVKLMGIIKYSHLSPTNIRLSFIATILGIMTSFLVLGGLVIGLKNLGYTVGWGFHFQEPYFIIFLILVLSLFAANMWGLFSIAIPYAPGQTQSRPHFYLVEHFVTGVVATLLATPCTAPFLGTAVSFALSQGTFEILTIFIAMGAGLSMPYTLVAISPSLVRILPKPGNWMNIIKYILGTFLACTAVWLLWVLSDQLGGIAALLLAGVILLKWFKLWLARHRGTHIKLGVIVIAFIFAFLIPSFCSKMDMPTSSDIWEPFSKEKLESALQDGQVVFVDITADWCLTCKVNKFLTLETHDVLNMFKTHHVILLQGDWTNKDISLYHYLQSRGVSGIPFNAVYGPSAPDGINLPVLLTKDGIKNALEQAQ